MGGLFNLPLGLANNPKFIITFLIVIQLLIISVHQTHILAKVVIYKRGKNLGMPMKSHITSVLVLQNNYIEFVLWNTYHEPEKKEFIFLAQSFVLIQKRQFRGLC